MSEEKKRFKNLSTYAIIMFLAAVILIIIAAMADTREEHFENQISQQTQLNMDIQNQIVTLEDENYKIKKELEDLKISNHTNEQGYNFYKTLSDVYSFYLQGKTSEAAKTLGTVDVSALNEEQKASYDTLQKLLRLPIPTKAAE